MPTSLDILIRARDEASATIRKVGAAEKELGTGVQAVDSKVAASSSGFSKWGSTIKSAVGIGGALAVAGFAKSAIDSFEESDRVAAQTASVIKATGDASGLSAQQFADLATARSKLTGIDDEAIQAEENWLATFRNVVDEQGKGNDIFTQTTAAIQDMASSMDNGGVPSLQDLQNVTTLVGKAMNDPIKGLTALRRVGVDFTAQQQDQIKALVGSGKAMEAQKIILGELNKEFGGSSTADTFERRMAKVGVTVDQVKEDLGRFITEGVQAVGGALQVASPLLDGAAKNAGLLLGIFAAYKFTPGILTAVGDALTTIGAAIADLIPGMGILTTETVAMGTAEAGLAVEATVAGDAVAAANVEMTATNPVALLAAAAVAALYVAFKELQAVISGDFSGMLTVQGDAPASWDRLAGGIAATTFTLGQLEKKNPPMLADPALFKQAQQWQAMATGMLDHWEHDAATAGAATDNLAGSTRTFGTQLEYARERQMGLIPFVTQAAASMWDEGQALDHARSMASKADQFFGTHIQTVQDLTKAYQGWQQQTADSINFVMGDLQTLAGDSKKSATDIAQALDADLAQMRGFGKNLDTILGDNSKGADALVQQLIAMGPAGQDMAAKIAGATPAVRHHIEDDIGKSLDLANKQSSGLERAMVGAMNNIAAAIMVMNGDFSTFANALYALNHKHIDIFFTTHYQTVGAPPPQSPAAQHNPQTQGNPLMAGTSGLRSDVHPPFVTRSAGGSSFTGRITLDVGHGKRLEGWMETTAADVFDRKTDYKGRR